MPIPLAVPLIAGAAAVKGISGIIGAGKGFTSADKLRLAELRRLQKAGALGLTDEELAARRDIILAPGQAAAREAQAQRLADVSIADVGSGAAARQAVGAETRAQQAMQPGLAQIAAEDAAEARAQKSEMQDLRGARADMKIAKRQAIIDALSLGLGAAGDASKELGPSQLAAKQAEIAAREEQRKALGLAIGYEDITAEEANELAGLLG